jgi:hypothetical protein
MPTSRRQYFILVEDLLCSPIPLQSHLVSSRIDKLSYGSEENPFYSLYILNLLDRNEIVNAAICAGRVNIAALQSICESHFPSPSQFIAPWTDLLQQTFSSSILHESAVEALLKAGQKYEVDPAVLLPLSDLKGFRNSLQQKMYLSDLRKKFSILCEELSLIEENCTS